MRIAVLHEPVQAGGRRRLETVLAAAEAAGHEVRATEMVAPSARRGTRIPLAWRWASLRDPQSLRRHLGGRADVLHVQGLPLAHAAVGAARIGLPSVVDCCDSWLNLAWSGRRDRGLAAACLASASAAVSLTTAARKAAVVTYISHQEAEHDRWLLSGVTRDVFGNSIDPRLFELDRVRPPLRLLTVSDFSYPPNLAGLQWALERVWPRLESRPWLLYGPEAPAVDLPEGVTYAGFLPDLRDVYDNDSVAFVPLLSGGGVKNKVLEALAAGLPVVTTGEGLRGLPGAAEHTWRGETPAELAASVSAAFRDWDVHVAGGRSYVRRLTASGPVDVWSEAREARR